jgi:hypothetical protein
VVTVQQAQLVHNPASCTCLASMMLAKRVYLLQILLFSTYLLLSKRHVYLLLVT